MIPRWYQQEALDAFYEYFANGGRGNPLICLPTGTGKAFLIAMLCASILQQWPTQRVMMATDAQELVAQNVAELRGLWPQAPVGVYCDGLGQKDARWPLTFGSIGSMWKCAEMFGHIDVLLIDEAHMLSSDDESMYNVFIFELRRRNPNLVVCGLTATPYRLGMGTLLNGGVFTDIIYDLTGRDAINRLVDEGHLCKLVALRPETMLSAAGVARRGGEFVEGQAQKAVDVPALVDGCVRETIAYGLEQDRKAWLVFAQGIEHIKHIVDAFNAYGVPAVGVHSKMRAGRTEALAAHQSGAARVIVNNGILTKGYNDKRIDLIAEMRLTNSPGLLVQMRGRGTRVLDGKDDCLVLDFAGNTQRCGPFNDPYIPNPRGPATGDAPVRVCDACGVYNPAGARFCGGKPREHIEFDPAEGCGVEFPREEKLGTRASTAEIMVATEAPVYEWFSIRTVSYTVHHKRNRPDSLRATYYALAQKFDTYQHFDSEHEYARHEARAWWRSRALLATEPPASVREALARTHELRAPERVRVWINTRYPEIVEYA